MTATVQGGGHSGHERGDTRPPRGRAQWWWLLAAATVLMTGSGVESLLWAREHGDVVRRLPMPAAVRALVTNGDDVIIAAAPTEYSLQARVGGVLHLDGGCLFVDHPAGLRSAVIWPAGTRWSSARRTVIHPRGARIRLGDTFYTAGGVTTAWELGSTDSDSPSLDRAFACGRRAGGSVLLLGPSSVELE